MEDIEQLLEDLVKGKDQTTKYPAFDVGFITALGWVLGKEECPYDR